MAEGEPGLVVPTSAKGSDVGAAEPRLVDRRPRFALRGRSLVVALTGPLRPLRLRDAVRRDRDRVSSSESSAVDAAAVPADRVDRSRDRRRSDRSDSYDEEEEEEPEEDEEEEEEEEE